LIAKYFKLILHGLIILLFALTILRSLQYILVYTAGEAIEATVIKQKIPKIAGPKPKPDYKLVFESNGVEKSLTVRGFNFFNPPIIFFSVLETGPLAENSKIFVWTFKNYFYLPFKPDIGHFFILLVSFLCYYTIIRFFLFLVKSCSTDQL